MLHHLAIATLGSLVSGVALAQEVSTYDLRSINQESKRNKAGGHYETIEIQKRAASFQAYDSGALVQDEQTKEKLTTAFITQVQAVNEQGRPTSMTWKFQRFGPEKDDDSHKRVDGVEILVTESQGQYSYLQRSGPEMSDPAFEKYLQDRMKDLSNSFSDSYVGSHTTLLPIERVSVGDTWDIDLQKMLSELEMPLVPTVDGQRASGLLASVNTVGEREMLNIQIEVRFPVENMQGAPCISDCLFSFDVQMTIPADSAPNDMQSTGEMVIKGTYGEPNTQSMSMDMKFDFNDTIKPIVTP